MVRRGWRDEAMSKIQDQLVVALGLALDEIRHPGASRAAGVDIDALCEGVIKKATKTNGIPQMVRDEIVRREHQQAMEALHYGLSRCPSPTGGNRH
jgi:hypothetical protein